MLDKTLVLGVLQSHRTVNVVWMSKWLSGNLVDAFMEFQYLCFDTLWRILTVNIFKF